MTDTDVQGSASTKATGLSGMLLPELKQLAQQMGISGASSMKKADLVAAIGERQRGDGAERPRRSARREQAPAAEAAAPAETSASEAPTARDNDGQGRVDRQERGERNDRGNGQAFRTCRRHRHQRAADGAQPCSIDDDER